MRPTHLIPALLLLAVPAVLTACASRVPVADRIVYRSSESSSPAIDSPAPQPRQPVRQMSEEERIRWHREHAPPPPPARVVYEVRETQPVRYEPPAIWWPPISIGLSYGRHWGHGRWGVGLGHRWGHHGYCGW